MPTIKAMTKTAAAADPSMPPTAAQGDLLKRATEMSVELANRLREFNKDRYPEVQPHLDFWQLGGRLQESIIGFLARREAIEGREGEPEAAKPAAAARAY